MDATRRGFLVTIGSAGTLSLAGCAAGDDAETSAGTNTTATTTRLRKVHSLPAPSLGPSDAPVTVEAYEDYACPHCRRYVEETLPEIRESYVTADAVRYEHHDFPIPVDERWSWQVASAARAVQDSVDAQAFFAFATSIYEHLGSYSLDVIGSTAAAVGADPAFVRTAAREETYRPVLEADRRRGVERGVRGTPTIFVNGEKLPSYEWSTVETAIESALP
ncbi:MAG: DsbA family protein [Halanaeroarchaeum sp.]